MKDHTMKRLKNSSHDVLVNLQQPKQIPPEWSSNFAVLLRKNLARKVSPKDVSGGVGFGCMTDLGKSYLLEYAPDDLFDAQLHVCAEDFPFLYHGMMRVAHMKGVYVYSDPAEGFSFKGPEYSLNSLRLMERSLSRLTVEQRRVIYRFEDKAEIDALSTKYFDRGDYGVGWAINLLEDVVQQIELGEAIEGMAGPLQ